MPTKSSIVSQTSSTLTDNSGGTANTTVQAVGTASIVDDTGIATAVTATDGTSPGAAALKGDVDARLVTIAGAVATAATATSTNAALAAIANNIADLTAMVNKLTADVALLRKMVR